MINAINTQSAAWTRALPSTGEVAMPAVLTGSAVQGTGVSKHRVFADNWAIPGTSAWSPPT